MDSQRFEVESEAWYRAVAEGKVGAGSDRKGGWAQPPPERPGLATGTRSSS